MKTRFIIFDVETNGLSVYESSVLSFSGLLVETWRSSNIIEFNVLEQFDRVYYPEEAYNLDAININGLSKEKINQRREHSNAVYPCLFKDDQEVSNFCNKAKLGVCHNTPFDMRFLQHYQNTGFERSFCTMRSLTEYCAIPHPYHGLKWPKLQEALDIVCGRRDFSFHDSLSDCYAVLELVKEMSYRGVDEFLTNFNKKISYT